LSGIAFLIFYSYFGPFIIETNLMIDIELTNKLILPRAIQKKKIHEFLTEIILLHRNARLGRKGNIP